MEVGGKQNLENKGIRISIILGSIAIFILVFVYFFPLWGGISGIFGIVPILLAGWFFNCWYSVGVGFAIMLINGLLYYTFGVRDYSSVVIGGIAATGLSVLASRQRVLLDRQRARTAESVQVEAELRRQAVELSTLVEASQSITTSLDLDEVFYQIALELTLAIDASGCTLSYWDKGRGKVVTWVEYRRDIEDVGDEPGTTYSLDEYPLTRRVLEGRVHFAILVTDPDADPAEREHMQRVNSTSLLMMPIISGDSVIGLVEIDDNQPREFSD